MSLSTLLSSILAALAGTPLATIAILFVPFALILLDLLTGIAAALSGHSFQWKMLSDFLDSNAKRYAVAVFLVFLVSLVFGNVVATALAGAFSLGPLALAMLASIGTNLKAILPKAADPAIDRAMQSVEQTLAQVTQRTPIIVPPVGQYSTAGQQQQYAAGQPLSVGQMAYDAAQVFAQGGQVPQQFSQFSQFAVPPTTVGSGGGTVPSLP